MGNFSLSQEKKQSTKLSRLRSGFDSYYQGTRPVEVKPSSDLIPGALNNE